MRARIFLILLPFVWLLACASNESPRTTYGKTLVVVQKLYDTVSDAVRAGLIRPGSDTALTINDARATVTAAMHAWSKNPDSVPYMNAALAAIPPLVALVERVTGTKFTAEVVYGDDPGALAVRHIPDRARYGPDREAARAW